VATRPAENPVGLVAPQTPPWWCCKGSPQTLIARQTCLS